MKDHLFILLSILIFTGCDNGGDFALEHPPVIVSNTNPEVPLAAYLDVHPEEPYNELIIFLTKSGEEEPWKTIEYQPEDQSSEGFPLFMVHPDQEYRINFAITDETGQRQMYPDTLNWKTPALPAEELEFPNISVSVAEKERMADGYTLMNPRRRIPLDQEGANEKNKSFGMLLAVDTDGKVVWYYRTDSRISDFDLISDDQISFMTQDSRLHVIDWMGNKKQIWYAGDRPEGSSEEGTPVGQALTFHHDATFMPNGNVVILSSEYKTLENYFTSETNANAPRKAQEVMGDIIIEFDSTGKVVWEWNTFDYLDPYRIGYETFSKYWERRGFPGVIDWSHANAIVYDDEDDAFIINFRYQSALMKIDKASKEIDWIFGEPSGWSSDLKQKLVSLEGEADWFWHQHSPTFEDGKILLFNNANYQARPFNSTVPIGTTTSHVLEFSLDEQELKAEQTWSTKAENSQKIVSIAMGDVDYLPNGNVLAAYGALIEQPALEGDEVNWWNRGQFGQWTMVREFTYDDPAEVVWELKLNSRDEDSQVGWTIFGAERFEK